MRHAAGSRSKQSHVEATGNQRLLLGALSLFDERGGDDDDDDGSDDEPGLAAFFFFGLGALPRLGFSGESLHTTATWMYAHTVR